MGLRETKKAKTRQLIGDIARDLFLEHGFEAVTVADVAAKAEVAVNTVFNYFPTKESLYFDLEDEIGEEIAAAIRDRKKDQSVVDAVHKYFLGGRLLNPTHKKAFAKFMKLVSATPALSTYYRSMFERYGKTIAREIQKESGATKLEADCITHLVLEAVIFACHSATPRDALNQAFKVLKTGWKK